jgi:hypothetical protein
VITSNVNTIPVNGQRRATPRKTKAQLERELVDARMSRERELACFYNRQRAVAESSMTDDGNASGASASDVSPACYGEQAAIPNLLILDRHRRTRADRGRNAGQGLRAARHELRSRRGAASVFVSYARKDERLRDKLSDHLGGLRTGGYISEWNDGQIVPGQEWPDEIIRRLHVADIILLLVTSSFLGSEYIGRVELAHALERHRRHEAIVIPVILKPADWQTAGLGTLQALPKGGKAVSTWPDQDDAFVDIARGLRHTVNEWRAS